MQLYENGIGPLSIAVRLGVLAENVVRVLRQMTGRPFSEYPGGAKDKCKEWAGDHTL